MFNVTAYMAKITKPKPFVKLILKENANHKRRNHRFWTLSTELGASRRSQGKGPRPVLPHRGGTITREKLYDLLGGKAP